MERMKTILAAMATLYIGLSPAHAAASNDSDIAKRCPEFIAWENAHPESTGEAMAKRFENHKPTQPNLRQRLLEMVKADQDARNVFIKAGMMRSSAAQMAAKQVMAIDAVNLKFLKPVVLRHGFPGPKQVGFDGVQAAFLLVQHADRDPAFQARVLPQLAALHRRGLVSGQDLGMLTDRVLRAKGKPQRYGTQFASDDSHPDMKLQPVEDISRLDARRAQIGMPPSKVYACVLSATYGKPVTLHP